MPRCVPGHGNEANTLQPAQRIVLVPICSICLGCSPRAAGCEAGTAGERGDCERGQQDKPTHIVSPSLDLLVESVLVFIPKGWVPNQQDVEDDTCPGEETGSAGENSLLEARIHTAWGLVKLKQRNRN